LARHFDLRFGLKERVSTAYELTHGSIPPADDLAPYQFEDTRATIDNLNLRDVLPLKPRRSDWAALLAASTLLLAFLLMDNPFTQSILSQRQFDQTIQEEIDALENTREDILGNQELTEAERQELLEPLDQALETLREPDISREEAVAAISEAERELEERQNGLSAEEETAFEEAATAMSGSELTEDVSEALSEGDLDEAAEEFEDLSESIDQAELSPEELQELSEQLSAAAQELQEVNPQAAEAMQNAAENLQNGQPQSASEALSEAAEALSEQGEQAQNAPQAQAAQQAGEQAESSRQQIAQAGEQQSGEPQTGEQGEGLAVQPSESEGEPGESGQIVPGEANPGEEGVVGLMPGEGDSSAPSQFAINSGQEGQGSSVSSSQSSNQPGQAGAGNAPGGAGSDTQQGTQGGNSQIDTQNAPGVNEGLGDFDAVFAPNRIGETGTQDFMGVDGEPTGDEILDQRQGGFNENFDADSTIPYDRVFADYANSVNENLEADYIPIGLRDVIRNYFSSLEP
jgi:hypothetical protein